MTLLLNQTRTMASLIAWAIGTVPLLLALIEDFLVPRRHSDVEAGFEAFDAACGPDNGDAVQEAIESQTDEGFGIINISQFPGAVMPFVPTGSDGTGPVHATAGTWARCALVKAVSACATIRAVDVKKPYVPA